VLCWVDHNRKPFHFYRLDPTPEAGKYVTVSDHVEQTCVGHAFVLAYAPPDSGKDGDAGNEDTERKAIVRIQDAQSLDDAILVGGYRAKRVGCGKDEDDAIWKPHLVEVFPVESREGCNCGRGGPFLRGSVGTAGEEDDYIPKVKLTVSLSHLDPTPLDTTNKPYEEMELGGWPVRLDADLVKNRTAEEEAYLRELEADLKVLCQRLPEHARVRLSEDTPLWINRTLRYGPVTCPIRGRGCCFHPDVGWLCENGLTPAKAGCVELYDLKEYCASRGYWGVGGVMLHEYSHAYHHKCLEGGYENKLLLECWKHNMKEKNYDCVPVHGPQGPTAKAYACTDQMEYFAELSAAFLGGLSNVEEYNKWFPFTRQQVKEYDPRAYRLLQELWKVEVEK